MTEPKSVENLGWNEKKSAQNGTNCFKMRLASEQAFSLLELMITSAIAGIVAIGASALYVFAIDNFQIIVNQNAAQENVLWAAYQSKSLMQQAVGAGCGPGTNGILCNFNSSLMAPNAIQTLADFDREASTGGSSWIQRTQIAYQIFQREINIANPAANANYDTYGAMGGALMINLSAVAPATVNDFITNSWFDRIVQYDVAGNGNTRNITIAARYFTDYDQSILNFCHPDNMGCGVGVNNNSYRDIVMTVNVTLRNNNVMATGNGPHGNLYYYRFLAPPMMIGF